MMASKGAVVIVGAGPGDPDLITLKGRDALAKADVVIYDRLVSERLLEHARPGTELIYAGKSTGDAALSQPEIIEMMITKARDGKHIVRLKGGDPTVLGRGGEEMVSLARAGVVFEIVPGVTSAVGVPETVWIPLTYRGLSSSLAVAPGREDPGKARVDVDFRKLAGAAGTLIVLMSLEHLDDVCCELMSGGLPGTTPAAVVKDGTMGSQQVVEGRLSDIASKVRAAGLTPPSLLVVGHVVRIRDEITALLEGRKVILTLRPLETMGAMVELLADAGYSVSNIPAGRVEGLIDPSAALEAVSRQCDYAVFTSQIGARALFESLNGDDDRARSFLDSINHSKVFAIGPKTRDALVSRGVEVVELPDNYSSPGLADALTARGVDKARIVLFRSDDADEVLEQRLRGAGASTLTIATHRMKPSDELRDAVRLLERGMVRAVVLTSPLIAQFLDDELKRAGKSLSQLSGMLPVFSIGPATSAKLKRLGVGDFVEAGTFSADGLLDAMRRVLDDNDR